MDFHDILNTHRERLNSLYTKMTVGNTSDTFTGEECMLVLKYRDQKAFAEGWVKGFEQALELNKKEG